MATSSSTSAVSDTVTSSNISWASGGTNKIRVNFPDTSLFDLSGTCNVELTKGTTEGPCYFGVNETQDISEGKEGLPMQLCLQLLDSSCQPLKGHLIEVWHCDNAGVYSGDTTGSDDKNKFAGDFCTGNDALAIKSKWFRGELTTDADGRVNFKSCFPGWYSSRVIHIHFRVKKDNKTLVTSQFCFTDDFVNKICSTHEKYIAHGTPDTTLASGDNVFPRTGYDNFLLETKQNSDGSLLAYKKIIVS